jgi:hypothetical protein
VTLYRHGRAVEGIFDLLGDGEVAHTAALGWSLAACDELAISLVNDLTGAPWVPVDVNLERRDAEGRTDIELTGETVDQHVIIEAKLGMALPTTGQLDGYVPRLGPKGVIAVVSHHPAIAAAPVTSSGNPVIYRMWEDIIALTRDCVQQLPGRSRHRRLLGELLRYLGKGAQMPGPTARVWVVPIAEGTIPGPVAPTDLEWIDVIDRYDRYFHPAASPSFPSPPNLPHYLGFRYRGELKRISHVDFWEVVDDLASHYPETPPGTFPDGPHVHYHLGPAIVPASPTRSGKVYGPGRHWADIDLLLTSKTVKEAVDATIARDAQPPLRP